MNSIPLTTEDSPDTDVFLLNKDNRAFVKGDQPFSPEKPKLWKPIILLLIGIVCLIAAAFQWTIYAIFATSGDTATAIITGVSQENCSSIRPCYYATYDFLVDGQVYSADSRINENTYRDLLLQEEVSIEITYLRGNPNITALGVQPSWGLTIITLVVILVGIAALVKTLRFRKRLKRLTKGQLQSGQVLEWHAIPHGEKFVEVDLTYTFNTPDGRPISADLHTKINYWNYKYAAPPQAGTPLAILYVDDNTYQVL